MGIVIVAVNLDAFYVLEIDASGFRHGAKNR